MSEIPPPTVPPATPPPPGGGSYTPPPPPPGGTSPSSDRTLMVVLSYLGLLALIPYLTKKDDPEIHWHAKNGVGLLILDVVVWVVFMIITWVLPSDLLGCGVGMIQCVVWIGILALHIYCIIQAVGGKRPRIPVVTDFAEKTL
ncbi:MAG: DUF4870 domain-containing protein [Thermoanaerobaculia bacterium]